MPEYTSISFEDLKRQIDESGRQYNMQLISKAYELAEMAHGDQKRRTGEPYIIHPLNVASLLVELGMDSESVAAGLLHDVVEDTNIKLSEIETMFGSSIAQLVDGVTKLGKIQFSTAEETQSENIRKMLLAMSKDIRVMLIKLCDRLHNMRTMDAMPPQKQRDKSLETMEVYAPIAHRLGVGRFKEELEDMALKYLDPYGYNQVIGILKENDFKEVYLNEVRDTIAAKLRENGIKDFTIESRLKSVYGIYRKLFIQNRSLEEIYDIYAVRVILQTIADCYNVLGILHEMYTPVPTRFKDYISVPKPNGYRSLQTSVIGKDAMPFEIQIRTFEMDYDAEYGIAAHWKYKEGVKGKDKLDERLAWIRQLLENQKESDDSLELLSSIRSDLLPEEVFAVTPKGEIINLPSGSTVIDFAYAIHTAVGNRMVGAKVNGRIVPLTYRINNGEIVEIITGPQDKGPSRDWLNIVQTSSAKNKIRGWFKKEKREDNIAEGKAIYNRELRRHLINIPSEKHDEVLEEVVRRLKMNTADEMYAAIGYGGITMSRVLPKVQDVWKKFTEKDDTIEFAPIRRRSNSGVIVEGIENCLIKFAKCCNPLPGDDIIGFITRGQGVTVHKKDCINIQSQSLINDDMMRLVKVEWANDTRSEFHTELRIIGNDRNGLLADITNQIASMRLPLYAMKAKVTKSKEGVVDITIGIDNKEHLENVMNTLRKVRGVNTVERINR
ncbi:MAG: bifunctional (p)ppGpp synthetase/guanosine-3',5'-bis(diphosphate) 3'-pyrophosphohydrolase [Oscillospiraceae bacterium]|nr:bifunctional (p)ppGpp synthetase/guanosine-3',5'-bis(diphosphate) 3'-pyrophosphohydrolase [Oscillospiraceae bacterium]